MKNRLIILLSFLLLCTMLFGTFQVSAEDVVTGFNFDHFSCYSSEKKEITLPATFEATICLPKDYSERAGVIIGNYSGGDGTEVNFEVNKNGKPRICINNVADKDYDIGFGNVDIRSEKPVHLAITVDYSTGTWLCYVDGVLKQTIKKAAPTPISFKTELVLGGDLRPGNAQYFKGTVFDVALYSDMRSEKEILADFRGDALDTDNIICAYDLTDKSLGSSPKEIPCQVNSGFSVFYHTDWISELDEPEDYAYSFAVIGDIQTLTCYYPDQLEDMYKWIRDNVEKKKIKYVLGLGDITDQNTDGEYAAVRKAYKYIDGVVPFSIIRGNHDREDLLSEKFDKYITKELYGDEITGSYDDTMKNTYRILRVGNVDYMFMNLDYLLKSDVLDWANTVIAEHPECRVIVSTHIYLTSSGAYYRKTSTMGTKYGSENDAKDLWDNLVSKHENIIMMICGHSPTDDIYRREKVGDNGNVVVEMLIDPQYTDRYYQGAGLVAMFYFSEDGSKLDVQYYSVSKDDFFKEGNQFTMTLDVPVVEVPETEASVTEAPETEAPVTEVPETEGPKTEAPDTEVPTTEAPETDAPENSGCGSSLAVSSVALVALLSTCTVFVSKKRS